MCLLFIILFGVYGGSRYCLGIPWEFYSIPITTLIVFVDGQGTIEGFFHHQPPLEVWDSTSPRSSSLIAHDGAEVQ